MLHPPSILCFMIFSSSLGIEENISKHYPCQKLSDWYIFCNLKRWVERHKLQNIRDQATGEEFLWVYIECSFGFFIEIACVCLMYIYILEVDQMSASASAYADIRTFFDIRIRHSWKKSYATNDITIKNKLKYGSKKKKKKEKCS